MRLGHAHVDVIKKHKSLSSLKNVTHCTVCPLAKQSKLPFQLRNTNSKSVFDLLHCDIWEPYKVPTYDGKKYFVTVIDDYTRYTWVFLIHSKSGTIVVLRDFLTKTQNVFSTTVKVIRIDNGSEFCSNEFQQLLSGLGIAHQKFCVYTPQQNGEVERKHKTILEMARSIRFQAVVPLKFWDECINTAVYLVNRIPFRTIHNKSPFEMLHLHPPSLNQRVLYAMQPVQRSMASLLLEPYQV